MSNTGRRQLKKGVAIFMMAAATALSTQPALVAAAVPEPQMIDLHLTYKPLTYRYQNIDFAEQVAGYNYIGGMMLPLSQTADLIGSFVQVDYQAGKATGWIETPDQEFLLDLPSRTLVIGEQKRVVPQGVINMVGEEMYVDASYLATLLPVRFIVNYDSNTIDFIPEKPLRVFQRLEFISAYFAEVRSWSKGGGQGWPKTAPPPANVAREPAETPLASAPPPPSGAGTTQEGGQARTARTSGASTTTHTPRAGSAAAPYLSASPEPSPAVPQTAPQTTPGVAPEAPVETAQRTTPAPTLAKDTAPAAQTGGERRSGTINVTSWDRVVLDTEAADQPLQPVANPVLAEEALVILQPVLDEVRGDYIEVYEHENGFYLPLGHLMDMLEIAIGVNPAGMEASGFFISEDRTFYLNGATGEAVVDGQTITFPPGLVVANPFELYVDAELLSRLLPTDFTLDMAGLMLAIHPRDKLPLQARLEREDKWVKHSIWHKFGGSARRQQNDYPIVETPYEAASVPFAEVRTGVQYNSFADEAVTAHGSIVAAGDVGYLNTEVFAQMDSRDDNALSNLRIKAGREDRNSELLGPLKATEAYVGDVQSYPMPLVASTSLGRGFRVSNDDVRRPSLFDETNFFGNSQPGWEVELYQNNVLIDFQMVGEDGRYEFQEVPVYFGENTFRIVQYGPQGQKQEEVRAFNIDDEMAQPGKLKYAVSVNEQGKSLLGIAEAGRVNRQDEGIAAIAQAEYGLTNKLAVGGGVAHVPIRDAQGNIGTYNFVSGAVTTSLLGVRTNWDTAYDVSNGGWATGVTGLYRWNGYNFRGEQSFFNDFQSAERRRSFVRPLLVDPDPNDGIFNIESPLTSRTEFNVSKSFDAPFIEAVTGSFNLRHEMFEEGESDSSLGFRVSKNMQGTNITNDLRYRSVSGTQSQDGDEVDGSFSIRHRWEDILLRGVARYEIYPEPEATGLTLSLQRQFTPDFSARFDYSHSLNDLDRRRFAAYLNWDLDKFYLIPRFEIDQDAEFTMGVDLQFSLGMDERTNQFLMTSDRIARSGAVAAHAYMDEDGDGVKDEGEPPVEGVTLISRGDAETDEQGHAFLTNLPPYYPYQLRVDKASLLDHGASPKEEGYNVVTRPGVATKLDIPIVPTVEVEGMAYLELPDETLEYPGLLLELVNADGEIVRSQRTEYDGYYYMGDIYPGVYTLRVSEEEAALKQLEANSYTIDTVSARSEANLGSLRGYDFTVHRKPGANMAQQQMADARDVVEAAEEALAEDVEPQIPPDTAPESPSQPQPEAAVTTQSKPQEAPKTVIPPRAPEAAEKRGIYVQAGLFCDYKNAQRQVETLLIAGFDATIRGRKHNGQACFNVQLGPQGDLAEAEQVVQALESMGLGETLIVEEKAEVYE